MGVTLNPLGVGEEPNINGGAYSLGAGGSKFNPPISTDNKT